MLKITYLITLLDNNGKYDVYTGGNIHGIHRYLEMIGAPTTLTTSGQRYHHFCNSYLINNDTESLQPVIVDMGTIQKSICEFCGRIEHKAYSYIIRGPKSLP